MAVVESRTRAGSLRTNNAIESFRNAFAFSSAQADRPDVARFLESAHMQQNMSCGAIAFSTHTPITDRELAEIEDGAQKPRGNARWRATEGWIRSQFDFAKTETRGGTCAERLGTTCDEARRR